MIDRFTEKSAEPFCQLCGMQKVIVIDEERRPYGILCQHCDQSCFIGRVCLFCKRAHIPVLPDTKL